MSVDDQIQHLAGRILEGAAIDWEREASGLDADSLDDLRALAAIVSFHRGLRDPTGGRPELSRLSPPSGSPANADHWGPLRLIERIGQGAFGEVYRAWDTRLDREVALKLLHRGSRDPDHGTVVEEGRLLARVRHPNVVTVFGAERIDDRVGIWTEFIHGSTLASRVQEHGPLKVAEVIAVSIDLCNALAAIHDAGLVHGDVKAQNVLQASGARTVLVDLGTGREHVHQVAATPIREISGTPLYMAPELWQRAAPTPQSDLYSLGVLLYYLLTAHYPVGGTTAADVRESHAAGQRVSLRDRRAGVPATVVAVVERMLDPDPARRVQSATEVRAALVRAAPSTIRRRRVRLAAGLAGAAGLVTIAILLWSGRIGWRDGDAAPQPLTPTQLTFQPPEDPVLAAAISPDKIHLAFATLKGVSVQTISTRALAPVPGQPQGLTIMDLAWVPGSSELIVATQTGLWRANVANGAWTRVFDLGGMISVSPDGRRLALSGGGRADLILLELDGGNAHEIVKPRKEIRIGRTAWAPDGSRLAYTLRSSPGEPRRLEIVLCRPDGSDAVHIPVSGSLRHLAWVEGRILYSAPSRSVSGRDARDDELWSIEVDAATGRTSGTPVNLRIQEGLNIIRPVLSGDRSRMVFSSERLMSQAVVADFNPGRALTNISQKVFMSRFDQPLAWLRGDEMLFLSNIGRQLVFFRQPVDRQEPRSLWPGQPWPNTESAAMSADGRWILYATRMQPTKPQWQLIRRGANGGEPEPILDLSTPSVYVRVRCGTTVGSMCVVAEHPDQSVPRLELTAVDPERGTTRKLPPLSASHELAWNLTPDGSAIVYLDATSSTGQLQIIDLTTPARRSVDAPDVKGANFIAWLPGGGGWIVAQPIPLRGGRVLHVDPEGRATVLWESPHQRLKLPEVSPDGRRIAFSLEWTDSNVWVLRGY